MYPDNLSWVSIKRQRVLRTERLAASLPTGRTELSLWCNSYAALGHPDQTVPGAELSCRGNFRCQFLSPLCLEKYAGTVPSSLLCTSAALDIMRIILAGNTVQRHCCLSPSRKTSILTANTSSAESDSQLHFKNHTRQFDFRLYQNESWINSPRRNELLTSWLVPMCLPESFWPTSGAEIITSHGFSGQVWAVTIGGDKRQVYI